MASRKAVIRNGKIIYDVDAEVSKPSETAARENREAMKTKHRGDMLQRNEVGYYKKYPKELDNLSPELKRLLS